MYQQQISREDFEKAHEQCETEPFLSPGSIQPHGVLIAFEADGLTIRQLSSNVQAWFGQPAEALLGSSLADVLPATALAALRQAIDDPGMDFFPLELHPPCHASLHHNDGLMILELEARLLEDTQLLALHRQARRVTRDLQNSSTLQAMVQVLTVGVRELLAVDQVVIYRFGLDGHGTVIGEARNTAMPSYLDQRFPATDVPQQVRRHATHHRLRNTPDIQAPAVPLLPALNPLSGRPLNQAGCQLRSPHFWVVQYYHNMGVRGVLALSIVQDGKLWGYLCVHHHQPRHLDRELLSFCELLVETFSALIRPREISDHQNLRDQLQTLLDQVLHSVTRIEPWFDGLTQRSLIALELMNASGLAIRIGADTHYLGEPPDTGQLDGLVNWLNARGEDVFWTDELGYYYQPATHFRHTGAGLLAVSISEPHGDWLLWFRPEVARTVVWAGKPAKLIKPGADGQPVLTPRDSFDRWVEQVEGRSLPFQDIHIELAKELRDALLRRLLHLSRDLQHHTLRHLTAVRERLNNLLGSLQDIVWQAEAPALQIRYISPPVESICGYAPEVFFHQPQLWLTMIHPEDRERVRSVFESSGHDQPFEEEYRTLHADGKVVWLRNRGRIIHDQASNRYFVEGIATEITGQKLMERQLHQQANYDLLTGLPNRYLTLDRLGQLCQRRHRSPFSLLYLDINRFKLINDSLGHEAGDQALAHFARQLEQSLRTSDTLGRLGGDEFVILLPDMSDPQEVLTCVQRINEAISIPLTVGDQTLRLGTSIGVLLVDHQDLQPDQLLHQADSAMYAAKRAHQLYRIFDASLDSNNQQELQLLNELRGALDDHQFQLYYQPVVNLPGGELQGFEALVRWQHPQRGLLAPAKFLPVVENSPFFHELGLALLDQASRQVVAWNNSRSQALSINVNFSAAQLLLPGFPTQLMDILAANHCRPEWIKVEITETGLLSNVPQALICLERLRQQGIQVWIDDFGTGYSSLNYLHRFPVSGLKIDHSFIHQLDSHQQDRSIVRSILLMANSLGLEVVAEGVETHAVATLLASLGCRYGQGFLFDMPLDAATAQRRVDGV